MKNILIILTSLLLSSCVCSTNLISYETSFKHDLNESIREMWVDCRLDTINNDYYLLK